MNINIIILINILVFLRSSEIIALKRIKRNFDLKSQKNRIKQDFVTLYEDKQQHSTEKPKELDSLVNHHMPQDISSEQPKKLNNPLDFILNEGKIEVEEHQRTNGKLGNVNFDSKAFKNDKVESVVKKSNDSMENAFDIVENSKGSFKRHKIKKHSSPHMLHPRGIVEANLIIPAQSMHLAHKGLSSITSIEQLMMMFKAGMDSMPHSSPKVIVMPKSHYFIGERNLYEPSYEPTFEMTFNSMEGAQHRPLQFNHPNVLNNNLQTRAIIYKTRPAVKESLMETALDALLDNAGDKNETEIGKNKSEQQQYENENDGNALKVCSCHFIKKNHKDEDDIQKK